MLFPDTPRIVFSQVAGYIVAQSVTQEVSLMHPSVALICISLTSDAAHLYYSPFVFFYKFFLKSVVCFKNGIVCCVVLGL